jgi:hypothetical protein
MTPPKPRPRPGQKSVDFGHARELIEAWCAKNAYVERTAIVAGWVAVAAMDHESRQLFFDIASRAIDQGKLDPKEIEQVAKATLAQPRPTGTSTASMSRPAPARAG